MKTMFEKNGSVLIVVVFAIALMTAFVVGMLEMNSEQIQLMKNEVFSGRRLQLRRRVLLMRLAESEAVLWLPALAAVLAAVHIQLQ